MQKIKRKKYVCIRQDGETFIAWAESPGEAAAQCADVEWRPWRVLRLPGAMQVDWEPEALPVVTEVDQAPVA